MHGLHQLQAAYGSSKPSRRVGRGHGSGRGTTAGRGTKGQKARTGKKGLVKKAVKEFLLKTPKRRGFRSPYPRPDVVNVGALSVFPTGSVVTAKSLLERHLVKGIAAGVKVLGGGKLVNALTVQAQAFSASAKAAIEAAGGQAVVIGRGINASARHRDNEPSGESLTR